MSVLTGRNLGRRFGPLDVFQGVDLRVEKGDRIGLVGPNGEGKTTLLRLLAGLDMPDEGQVHRIRGLTIGYLPQDPPLPGERTLWQDVSQEFDHLKRQADRLHGLEEQMADPETYLEALATYEPLQARFEAAGGYQWELRVRQVLTGLGFRPDEHHMPLAHLSGGQRTRGLLARLLLNQPDLLLMDEPTNHLDLSATEWLEGVLLQWQGSMVVVSHDRYFLDRVATRIWDLANQRMEIYRGNYSHYVRQRADRRERLSREWKQQQAHIAKEEDFIRRNIAGQKTRQAQGRRTRLERMVREGGLVERPRHERSIRIHMESRLRSANLVLRSQDLAVGYRHLDGQPPKREDVSGGFEYIGVQDPPAPADTLLFRSEDIELRRGERAALLGPNGAGKSTFLKTITGQLSPFSGKLRVGSSVRPGYLAQAHAGLRPDMTVLDAILEKAPRLKDGEARGLLGRFLFRGDDVFQTIDTLSGGQRSRVALARLTLEGANLLLLDEPTNHLDITSQEILEAVLNHFPGTVLLVTHDRYLVDAVATQVWMIQDGALRVYKGNYSDYLAAKAAEDEQLEEGADAQSARLTDSQLYRKQARETRRQRKAAESQVVEAKRLEDLIEALEERLQSLGAEIDRAGEKQDTARVQQLGLEYQAVDQRLQQLLEEWSGLGG
ncbi:MAG: ABC-F family ATP-binding cassette domain-containing protein [Chloroflexota bacterium]|nr:ABC-F family ATP-binding cassette domain-containing protein [Chloroflexota bacterium]